MSILYLILGLLLIYTGYKLLITFSKQLESDDPNQHGIDYVGEDWKGNRDFVKSNHAVQRTLLCVFILVGGMLLTLFALASMVGVKFKF